MQENAESNNYQLNIYSWKQTIDNVIFQDLSETREKSSLLNLWKADAKIIYWKKYCNLFLNIG